MRLKVTFFGVFAGIFAYHFGPLCVHGDISAGANDAKSSDAAAQPPRLESYETGVMGL